MNSKNFKDYEFSCGDRCGLTGMDHNIYTLLELIRCHFKAVVIVTSGCRCESYNDFVGGASGSYHLPTEGGYSRAVDIVVRGVEPKEVYDYLTDMFPDFYGIAYTDDFLHLDTRPNKKTWQYT